MTESLDELLRQALLIAVGRDAAKALFAAREPAALRQFLAEWLRQIDVSVAPSEVVRCGGQWPSLEQAFDLPGLVSELSQPALQLCLSRGRTLCDAPGLRVALVRPDLVPHIATALAGLATDRLRACLASWPEANAEAICDAFTRIAEFYGHASRERASVVFAADR